MFLNAFCHVYADGQWGEPMQDYVRAINDSGLPDYLDDLFIGFVGTPENCDSAENWLRGELDFAALPHKEEGWEQETLRFVQAMSGHLEGGILYSHSKGSASALIEGEPHELNRVWRRSMYFDCITNWERCVELLETHDAVGPQIIPVEYGGPYYAGNTWWATTEYLRTLPPLSEETRHHAENWIGLTPNADLYEVRSGWPGFDTLHPVAP